MYVLKKQLVADIITEILSAIALLLIIVVPIVSYSSLSAEIPIHYDIYGEADGYGDKSTIFIITTLAIITYIAISVLQRKPPMYNFPVAVKDDNREQLYILGAKMLIRIKLLIMALFLSANIKSAPISEKANSAITWIFYSIIALIAIISVYYIGKMYTLKR